MFWRRDVHKKSRKPSHHKSTRALDLVGIYEDEIEKEDRRVYIVVLPYDYTDETPINVLLSGTEDVLHIEKLPDGIEPGSSIRLIVASDLHEWVLETNFDSMVASTVANKEDSSNLNLLMDVFWIIVCGALLSFSIASFSVATFADMKISDGCLAENPNDSTIVVRKMYFLLFQGLCSNSAGITGTNNDFCISWSEHSVWRNVDSVLRSDEKMYVSAKGNPCIHITRFPFSFHPLILFFLISVVWPVAQVMSVLAFVFFLCALSSQIMAIIKSQRLFVNKNSFYYIALCCVLLAFVCSLVAILEVEFSATLKETLWETFFDRSTFSNALAGDTTSSNSPRTNIDNPCVVLTGYKSSNEGMLFLILTVPLSFLLFWWILGFKIIKPVEL